jgi:hypothetical protein
MTSVVPLEAAVIYRLAAQRASGVETEVTHVVPREGSIVLTLWVKRPSAGGSSRELTVHQVLRLRKDLIADIRGYSTVVRRSRLPLADWATCPESLLDT